MVADECARLMASTVSVVSQDGVTVESERDERNSTVMRESVDGGVTPAGDFWLDVFSDLLTDGNALIAPILRDGVIVRLRLLRARDARFDDATASYYGKVQGEGEREVRVPQGQMAHARMYGSALSRGGRGRQWPFSDSPIRLLRDALAVSESAADWIQRSLIGPKGQLVISPKTGRLGKDQQKAMTAQVDAFRRSRKPLVVGGPVDVETFTPSAREAQITDIRDFQLREVARVYGVPLPLIGSPVSAWGSGIEALAREYWKRAIAPRMFSVLSPLSLRLCGPKKVLTVDPLELYRGDSNDMVSLLTALRPNTGTPPIATLNEMRRIAGLPVMSDAEERALREQAEWLNAPTAADDDAGEESGAESAEEEEVDSDGGARGNLPTRDQLEEMLATL